MILRRARYRDAFRLWRWRNHPSTRQHMIDTERIRFVDHLRWLRDTIRDPDRELLIVAVGRLAVGSCRLDRLDRGGASIDIVIAPRYRSRGYGRQALELLTEYAQDRGVWPIVAWVRANNIASTKAFLAAGFHYVSEASVPGYRVFECGP